MSTRPKRGAPEEEPEPELKKVKVQETEEDNNEEEDNDPIPVEEAAADESVLDAATPSPNKGTKRSTTAQVDVSAKHPSDPNNFNDFLFALLAHKADNANFHVTREENPNLHMWLQHLKREYKNHLSEDGGSSSLTEVQVKVLEHLHVPLTSRGDDHWNRFYQLLQAYADRHGHVLVPRLCEIPGLGDWVTDQRRQVSNVRCGHSCMHEQKVHISLRLFSLYIV